MYHDNIVHIPAGRKHCLFHHKVIRAHIMDTTAAATRHKRSFHWDIRHTLGLFLFVVMIGYFVAGLTQ